MLGENFREYQHIIDAAEHIVKAAPAISGKKAKASGAARALVPVQVLDRDEAAWRSSCWRTINGANRY